MTHAVLADCEQAVFGCVSCYDHFSCASQRLVRLYISGGNQLIPHAFSANGREEDMPRFYFDLKVNGDLSLDQDGHEFSTPREAHRQAILALAEMAAEKIPENGTLDIRIVVADDCHRPVAQAHVHFEPNTSAMGK